MPWFHKSAGSEHEWFNGLHRFEHWYRNNSVYFITSSCRERYPAFRGADAKEVFRDRFDHYSDEFGFVPWVTSLLDTHYHTLGYLKVGENLGTMMQRLHGSVAKLVNDLLPERRLPFWEEEGGRDYFDGCIRDEKQCRDAYAYTLNQSVKGNIARDWRHYPHTRVNVDVDRGVKRALELHSFMTDVEYHRYTRGPDGYR
jgi:hypothetical protein